MVPAAMEISDEAIRRWHELLERRAVKAATRCSCGCRCDAGRPRPANSQAPPHGDILDTHDRTKGGRHLRGTV
jgi:hypothetical protein